MGRSIEKAMHFGAKAELFRLAQEMRKINDAAFEHDDGRTGELE
jgi:hypothetical protein